MSPRPTDVCWCGDESSTAHTHDSAEAPTSNIYDYNNKPQSPETVSATSLPTSWFPQPVGWHDSSALLDPLRPRVLATVPRGDGADALRVELVAKEGHPYILVSAGRFSPNWTASRSVTVRLSELPAVLRALREVPQP